MPRNSNQNYHVEMVSKQLMPPPSGGLARLFRDALIRLGRGSLLPYFVNEYPRSGGGWIAQMLAEAMGVPFCNGMPRLGEMVIHGHHLIKNQSPRMILAFRDGRDVMVSWYYHCYFENEYMNASIVKKTRRECPFSDYSDIRNNLSTFIQYSFTKQGYPPFNWMEFVRFYSGGSGVVSVKYEDMLTNTAAELKRIVSQVGGIVLSDQRAQEIVEKYSFKKRVVERGVPGGRSFFRQGRSGGWRECFNSDAREIFCQYAGEGLIMLGYEKDQGWVENEG